MTLDVMEFAHYGADMSRGATGSSSRGNGLNLDPTYVLWGSVGRKCQ